MLPHTPTHPSKAGLKLDPFNLELKQGLQEANAAVLRDLAEGRARETRAIEYPEARQRISYHPCVCCCRCSFFVLLLCPGLAVTAMPAFSQP